MKNINFIKPIPPSKALAMKTWIIISLFWGTSLILCMCIVTWQDYFNLGTLKNTKKQLLQKVNSFSSIMERKQELKKKEQALKEQLNLIASSNQQTQQHILLMTHIKKALKNTATLESFNLESTDIQLCIDCTQSQQASEIVTSLAQVPNITGLYMSSLQPKQQGAITALRLNLRGTIKQNT